ncbi:MAG: thiamine pyrophosphate-binding protein, partial [Phycisphaerae bacterium]|nr:thiamine pyrophosphate-binding protein [Phycisphaerae bacterium]
ALGASFAAARSLVTMKHVGLNVAADPLFTAAYTGVTGAMVVVCADDPGMASSQNEQDNRRYALAACVPMFEPSDSQQAYDFTLRAMELSELFGVPVLLRMTTRTCHSKTVVIPNATINPPAKRQFERDVKARVMIPAYAKEAHKRLREKLARIAQWNETSDLNEVIPGDGELGIIATGVSYVHAREAAVGASFLRVGLTHPLPMDKISNFVRGVERCVVIEEGDPVLVEQLRAAGLDVEGKDEMYRFGELNVQRVRRILAGDTTPEFVPPKGKSPQLCSGCPHRKSFEILRKLNCIVAGDIGCYTLGVLPPFEAMDTCVCMGASISVGLGMRHVLGDGEARRVVSVIGDSTFVHSGITGLVDMVYNPPPTGHVVLILDNGTTAMTGLQEHPGTGRKLDHSPTTQIVFEDLAKSLGIGRVEVFDPVTQTDAFENALAEALESGELCVLIARRPCLLAAKKIRRYESLPGEGASDA